MPLPKTTNVGTLISELVHKGKKKRPRKQIIAIALDVARRNKAKGY